ncbi:MAG: hypothetical protein V3V78_02300 [Candidatus Woesearchaeota archaeon]
MTEEKELKKELKRVNLSDPECFKRMFKILFYTDILHDWQTAFFESGESLAGRIEQLYSSNDADLLHNELVYLLPTIIPHSHSSIRMYEEDISFLLNIEGVNKSLKKNFITRRFDQHYNSYQKLLKCANEADGDDGAKKYRELIKK